MAQPIHVLIIENSEDDAILVAEQLRRSGYDPNWKMVDNAADLTEALAADSWDLFLCDYSMPGFSGMKALEIYKTFGLDIPFFLVSGLIGEERAVEAMRAGAHDCIMKDRLSRLGPAVERELREAANRRERRQADLEIHRLNSELQRLNAQLQEKLELLSRSNAELEQFAWAASHDLKEPLRTVVSYCQLLLRRRQHSVDPEELEFMQYIRGAVDRMHALIDGLLAYSRAMYEPLETARRTDAGAVAAEAVQVFQDVIEQTGAIISIDPLPPVTVHEAPLLQVFQNLIGNALKYRRTGVPARIRISGFAESGQVRFAVADNGIGIKPEHYERIFVLFRRLHGSELPGVGVGLALCKRLVERHGGRIWIEAEPGAGSTFYFTLPAAQAVNAAAR
jgi:light-regulated signal transduction histidine kinase (bacteriophytochrome)